MNRATEQRPMPGSPLPWAGIEVWSPSSPAGHMPPAAALEILVLERLISRGLDRRAVPARLGLL
jgi:hypothetical protein